jgi:hypothetical protein
MRYLLLGLVLLSCLASRAQYNQKGSFHVAVGVAIGGHRTEYVQTSTILGVPIRVENNDGAGTVLFPIDVQYGVAKPVSLGLFLEPGSYLDSNATRSNSLVLFGFQPRGYIINNDRFSWFGSLQIGSGTLRINDTEAGVAEESRYAGPFFGLGSGVGFLFGEHFGLQGHLRYMGSTLTLTDYSKGGSSIDLSAINAELSTTGFSLQASLTFRF